jgi:hypothetical protein
MRLLLHSLALGASLVALGCAASLKPYVEPPVDAPHALVKVRLVHHAQPGPMYAGSISLNNLAVELPLAPTQPATRALRVRPEGASWRIGSEFFHLVTRTETYTTTESYVCGQTSGYNGTSTPQYCTRQVQHTRTVTDHVTDAACAAIASHAPVVGTTYIVEFEFTGNGKCSAMCYEQKFADDGTFSKEPCVGSRSGLAQ